MLCWDYIPFRWDFSFGLNFQNPWEKLITIFYIDRGNLHGVKHSFGARVWTSVLRWYDELMRLSIDPGKEQSGQESFEGRGGVFENHARRPSRGCGATSGGSSESREGENPPGGRSRQTTEMGGERAAKTREETSAENEAAQSKSSVIRYIIEYADIDQCRFVCVCVVRVSIIQSRYHKSILIIYRHL